MAVIHFYGKLNCINNLKQQEILRLAGHELIVHDILAEPWSVEKLKSFFIGRPVPLCFNPAAPAIKRGEVNPEEFTFDQALEAMLADPYLIKRPLMIIGDVHLVGFEEDVVSKVCSEVSQENCKPIDNILAEDVTRCHLMDNGKDCDSNTYT